MTRILNKADLAHSDTAYEFEGHHHDAGVSFIMIDAPPGSGPKLHKHPYEEIFVVQEGSVTFTARDDVIEAGGGLGLAPLRITYARALDPGRELALKYSRSLLNTRLMRGLHGKQGLQR